MDSFCVFNIVISFILNFSSGRSHTLFSQELWGLVIWGRHVIWAIHISALELVPMELAGRVLVLLSVEAPTMS